MKKYLKLCIMAVLCFTLLFTSNAYADSSSSNEQKELVCIVQEGDTLQDIANRYNIAKEIIAFFNNIKITDILYAGQKIYVPANIGDLREKFVDDPDVLGTWESVDFVGKISDFKPNSKQWPGDLHIKKLVFDKNGVLFINDYQPKPYFAWTKGLILHKNSPSLVSYEIKNIDGIKYLFYQWNREKPNYYVLKYVGKLYNPALQFEIDPEILGLWNTVDIVTDTSEFKVGVKKYSGNFNNTEFEFLDNARAISDENPWLLWTKGYVTNPRLQAANSYSVKVIDGAKYMFLEWKTEDSLVKNTEPFYYVLKFICRIDNIDLEFVSDSEIIGVWKTVDIVNETSEFVVGVKKYERDFVNTQFNFSENGIAITGKNPWLSWTKGFVLHSRLRVANGYFIKEINGTKYMFLEWKTGDYVFRGAKPYYYVLKKD